MSMMMSELLLFVFQPTFYFSLNYTHMLLLEFSERKSVIHFVKADTHRVGKGKVRLPQHIIWLKLTLFYNDRLVTYRNNHDHECIPAWTYHTDFKFLDKTLHAWENQTHRCVYSLWFPKPGTGCNTLSSSLYIKMKVVRLLRSKALFFCNQ